MEFPSFVLARERMESSSFFPALFFFYIPKPPVCLEMFAVFFFFFFISFSFATPVMMWIVGMFSNFSLVFCSLAI